MSKIYAAKPSVNSLCLARDIMETTALFTSHGTFAMIKRKISGDVYRRTQRNFENPEISLTMARNNGARTRVTLADLAKIWSEFLCEIRRGYNGKMEIYLHSAFNFEVNYSFQSVINNIMQKNTK